MIRVASVVVAIAATLLASILLPSYTADDDARLTRQFTSLRKDISSSSNSYELPVISFNVRLDRDETDPNNHFTKRVDRISAVIERLSPAVVGMQEPFSGQVMHLQSHLPSYFDAIGYDGGGHDEIDRANPIRHADYQTGILYDTRRLDLIRSDHLWLSRTPRTEHSADWNTGGIRTVTIGHFRIRHKSSSSLQSPPELLVFNTHLDVFCEEARYQQAQVLLQIIADWSTKHPDAIVMVLGDFNTAPNQRPYNVLLTDTGHLQLQDAWVNCAASSHCVDQSFAASFHGWQGTLLNTYLGRAIQMLVMSLHGSDFNLPRHIPSMQTMPALALQIIKEIYSKAPTNLSQISEWWKSLPPFNRFHVDWILYNTPHHSISSEKTRWLIQPRMVFVADARNTNYSSDHFPIAGLFEITSSSFTTTVNAE